MIVYMYTFPNGKKYVGQTIQTLEKRSKKGDGYKQQPLIYHAIQKYGWDNIQKEIFKCSSEEEMDRLEQELIAKYNTTNYNYGYNLDSGGHLGKHHSEETKQKISNSISGINHPFYGTHRSEETKEKLHITHLGKHHSEETKQKISEGNKGKSGYWKDKTFSEQHKQNIGRSVAGQKNGMFGKGTAVLCIELHTIYPSLGIAAKAVGLKGRTAISNTIHGRSKTAQGMHWMTLEDYKNKYGEIDDSWKKYEFALI